ncbi:MAG: YdiU family protein [Pseudomonadales bacterium]
MNPIPPLNNRFAELDARLYSPTQASTIGAPSWVIRNHALANQLGIDLTSNNGEPFLSAFSGGAPLPNSRPLAMVYAGHQFGHYVNQLGDGRGLLLGEIDTAQGAFDLHLKGAGPTPYSRMGDGRAVLRSSIREYLCGEAMTALGIASTRSLCITTGEQTVWREKEESAAMLVRVARSHIRFGSFEFFHYTEQPELVKKLADFCIEQYFPQAAERTGSGRYAVFLSQVVEKTARMIAQWQSVGFAHGVMNTDNMSILGETFDYGPFGFLDDYNEGFVCNHSDNSGRYAFNAQPGVALWNLNALAQALSSLIDETQIKAALAHYRPSLIGHYSSLMRSKLGLQNADDNDQQLVSELLELMQASAADFTNTFRQLGTVSINDQQHPLRDTFVDRDSFDAWLVKYQQRLKSEGIDEAERQQAMAKVNPKYVLRNYLAQQAIDKAEVGDYKELEQLAEILSKPFDEQPEFEDYAKMPPDWGKRISVSCSS